MAATYLLVLGGYTTERYLRFRSGTFDLGIFDQAVYLMSRGLNPFLTTRGVFVQEDHFQPILFLVAPLYYLWSSPVALLWLQTAILACGVWPAYRLARHHRLSEGESLLMAGAYLCLPAIQYLNAFDFHPVSIMASTLIWALWFLESGCWWAYGLCLVLSLMCTEAAGFTVGLLAFNALLIRGWRWGGATAALALAGLVVAKLSNGAFPHSGMSPYAALYAQYGTSEVEVVTHLLRHPLKVLAELSTFGTAYFLMEICGSLAFLPVLSPVRLLPSTATLLGNLLSWRQAQHSIAFHYGAALAPFYFWAAVSGLGRTRSTFRKVCLLCVGAASLASLGFGPLGSVHGGKFYFHQRIENRYLEPIESGQVVSAGTQLGAHLSQRASLYLFPNPFVEAAWGNRVESLVQQSSAEYEPISLGDFRRGLEQSRVDWVVTNRRVYNFPLNQGDAIWVRRQVERSPDFQRVDSGPDLLIWKRVQP